MIALVVIGAAIASADLRVRDCAERDAIVRIAELELSTQAPADGSPPVVTAEIHCEGDHATLYVTDDVTGKSLERTIDFPADPKGRARLLALALAELVRASWVELAMPPPPLPPRTTAPEPVRREIETRMRDAIAPPVRERASLWLFGALRGTFTGTGPMGGGGMAVEVPVWKVVTLDMDARYTHGEQAPTFGVVTIDVFDAAIHVDARATPSRVVDLEAGVGARVGFARFTGTPSSAAHTGATESAPWGGPELAFGVSFHASALDVRVRFETGTPLAGVRATSVDGAGNTVDRVAIAGPWLGATIGAGVRF